MGFLLEEKLEPNAGKRCRDPYKAPVACHIDSYYVLKYLLTFAPAVNV